MTPTGPSADVTPTVTVAGGTRLQGRVRVPGDKSISHRALLLAALADGTSSLRGLSGGDDVRRSAAAVAALGAVVTGRPVTGRPDAGRAATPDGAAPTGAGFDAEVAGGPDRLHQPDGPLDLGNSGTGLRLVAGLVAGWPWTVELTGDASLSSRPMDRIAGPLRAMGAVVDGRGERCLPPVVVRGGHLHGIDYTPPMASAQVKSCLLLAGLRAAGETVVREAVLTRVHTEELLAAAGADIAEANEAGVHVVRLRGGRLRPLDLDVAGDPSQAAFWVVAACVVPGSTVTVESIYAGPARRGFLDVLRRMGAAVEETPTTRGVGTVDVTARFAPLRPTEVDAAEIPSLDEVPILAVAAAAAEGTTVFRDVGELRVKESDRLHGVAALVRAFGAGADIDGDDLAVHGAGRLHAGRVDAGGDHRMAMAGAVAGLVAAGETVVEGWGSVATSYPGFAADLAHLGGRLRIGGRP